MSSELTHISAISLFVEDLAAARSFYQSVFDAPVVYEDASSTALRFGAVIVNLLHVDSAPTIVEPARVAPAGAGVRCQLSIWVHDVDAVHARLQQLGIPSLVGPTDRPWGMRTVTFLDPAGHSWEVAQRI